MELDLDELTQEDKFYLIQQIEDIQKNIRYYSSNQETFVFQDFEDGHDKQEQRQASRYNSAGDEEELADERVHVGQQSPKIKMSKRKAPDKSPKSSINPQGAISFVASALGPQINESLEIIEDADEVEEEELDNINVAVSPQNIINLEKHIENEEPKLAPFTNRKHRRMLNEGQKQILSKGELKRYKGGEVNSSAECLQNSEVTPKEPEDASQPIQHRTSKLIRDADVLRFSKASSLD